MAVVFPRGAGLWHSEKNQGLTPDRILAGTNKKYWWKCPKGVDHEWEAMVTVLVHKGTECPYCAGQRLSVTNSLRALNPEIADELHPDKNGRVTADQILAGSSKKYWWQCPFEDSHQWKTTVDKRTSTGRQGCPDCVLVKKSRQEIELVFELKIFFEFDIDDHKESVGDKRYDCDIIIRQHGLIVEFDSSHWHKDIFHRDKEKAGSLQTTGWKVITVREQPLPMTSPMDVSVPKGGKKMKPVVDAVLLKIRETLNIQIDGLDAYLKATGLQNGKASDAAVKRHLALMKKASSPSLT